MIRSFGSKATAQLFRGEVPRGMARDLATAARRKLLMLDAAETLDDLRQPPGNRLEVLRGDRAGQHSIRVNDQWRPPGFDIMFTWRSDGPHAAEIVDYH